MRPDKRMLRCYAECTGNQWHAICVNPYLTTQADTFSNAKSKLKAVIGECVFDDLTGDDREFYGLQLADEAPLFTLLKYWFYMALSKIPAFHDCYHKLFTAPFNLAQDSNGNPTLLTEGDLEILKSDWLNGMRGLESRKKYSQSNLGGRG